MSYVIPTDRTGELKFKVDIGFDFSKSIQYTTDYLVQKGEGTYSDIWYGGYNSPPEATFSYGSANPPTIPALISLNRSVATSGLGIDASAIVDMFGLKINPYHALRGAQRPDSGGVLDLWNYYGTPLFYRAGNESLIKINVSAHNWSAGNINADTAICTYTIPTGIISSYVASRDYHSAGIGWVTQTCAWELGYANLKGTVSAIITTSWEEVAEMMLGNLNYHRWRSGIPSYELSVSWEGMGSYNEDFLGATTPITGSTNKGLVEVCPDSFTLTGNTVSYSFNTSQHDTHWTPQVGDTFYGYTSGEGCWVPSSNNHKWNVVSTTYTDSSLTRTVTAVCNKAVTGDTEWQASGYYVYLERPMTRDVHSYPCTSTIASERYRYKGGCTSYDEDNSVARTQDSIYNTPNAINIIPYVNATSAHSSPTTGEASVSLYTANASGDYIKVKLTEFEKETPVMASGRSASLWVDSTGTVHAKAEVVVNPYINDSNANPGTPSGKITGASAACTAYMDTANEFVNTMSVYGTFTVLDYPHSITMDSDLRYPDGSKVSSGKITAFTIDGQTLDSSNSYTGTFGGLWYAHNFSTRNLGSYLTESGWTAILDSIRPADTKSYCQAIYANSGVSVTELAPDMDDCGNMYTTGGTYTSNWIPEYCGGDCPTSYYPLTTHASTGLILKAWSQALPTESLTEEQSSVYAIFSDSILYRLNPYDGTISSTVSTGCTGTICMAVSPDCSTAVVGNASCIYKVNISSGAKTVVASSAVASAMCFDSDGYLYVGMSNGDIRKYTAGTYASSSTFSTYSSAVTADANRTRNIVGMAWSGGYLCVAHNSIPGTTSSSYIARFNSTGSYIDGPVGYTDTTYICGLCANWQNKLVIHLKSTSATGYGYVQELTETTVTDDYGVETETITVDTYNGYAASFSSTGSFSSMGGRHRLFTAYTSGGIGTYKKPEAWVFDYRLPEETLYATYRGTKYACSFIDPDCTPQPVVNLIGPTSEVCLVENANRVISTNNTISALVTSQINPRLSDGSYIAAMRVGLASNTANSFARLDVCPTSLFEYKFPLSLERDTVVFDNPHSRTIWSYTGTVLPSWMVGSNTWYARPQSLASGEQLTVGSIYGINRSVDVSIGDDKLYTWYNGILYPDTASLTWPSTGFTLSNFIASSHCKTRTVLTSSQWTTPFSGEDYLGSGGANDGRSLSFDVTIPSTADGTVFTVVVTGNVDDTWTKTYSGGGTSVNDRMWGGEFSIKRVSSSQVLVTFTSMHFDKDVNIQGDYYETCTTTTTGIVDTSRAVFTLTAGVTGVSSSTLTVKTTGSSPATLLTLSISGTNEDTWKAFTIKSEWPNWDAIGQYEVNKIKIEEYAVFTDAFTRTDTAVSTANSGYGSAGALFTSDIGNGWKERSRLYTTTDIYPDAHLSGGKVRFYRNTASYTAGQTCPTAAIWLTGASVFNKLSAELYSPAATGVYLSLFAADRTNYLSNIGVMTEFVSGTTYKITYGWSEGFSDLATCAATANVVLTEPSYIYTIDLYENYVYTLTIATTGTGTTVYTATVSSANDFSYYVDDDGWAAYIYIAAEWKTSNMAANAKQLYVDNVTASKHPITETFPVTATSINATGSTRSVWTTGKYSDFTLSHFKFETYTEGNWLAEETQIGTSPTKTADMQLEPGKLVFIRNGGGLDLGDKNNHWPHYCASAHPEAVLDLHDIVLLNSFSYQIDEETSGTYADSYIGQWMIHVVDPTAETIIETMQIYPNDCKYALTQLNAKDFYTTQKSRLSESSNTALTAIRKVNYLSGLIENITYNSAAAFTVKPWAIVGTSLAGISTLNDMPLEVSIADSEDSRTETHPGTFIHMGLSPQSATITPTRSTNVLPTGVTVDVSAPVLTVPATSEGVWYRPAYLFKSMLDPIQGPVPPALYDIRNAPDLSIGPYNQILEATPYLEEQEYTIPDSQYVQEAATTPDTVYRKVISATNYPAAVVSDVINKLGDNLLTSSFRTDTDSYIWRTTIEADDTDNTTVSVTYTGSANSIVPRRAVSEWDFFDTSDPVWMPASFIEKQQAGTGEGDLGNYDTYIYLRNLEVTSLPVTCTTMNEKTLIVSDVDDFYEDSPVWYELPEAVRNKIPENFYWVTIPNQAVDIEESGVYALLFDIGSLEVRYRSNALLTALCAVDVSGNPTARVTALGQTRSLQRYQYNNLLDNYAELAGLTRSISPDSSIIESNTSLSKRIENAGILPRGDNKIPLIFSIANQLGEDGNGDALVEVVDFQITDASSAAQTVTFSASGIEDVVSVYVVGLDELTSISEEAVPNSTKTEFYVNSKIDEEYGYNILIDGVHSTGKGVLGSTCKSVVFTEAVSGSVTVTYMARTYTLTSSGDYITSISSVSENTPVGTYKVLLLRKLTAGSPSDSSYYNEKLLDASGAASKFLMTLSENIKQSTPISIGTALWGDRALWFEEDDVAPGVSYLPLLLDNAGQDS